jgi:hypothetical protein
MYSSTALAKRRACSSALAATASAGPASRQGVLHASIQNPPRQVGARAAIVEPRGGANLQVLDGARADHLRYAVHIDNRDDGVNRLIPVGPFRALEPPRAR